MPLENRTLFVYCRDCSKKLVLAYGFNAEFLPIDKRVKLVNRIGWRAAPYYLCQFCVLVEGKRNQIMSREFKKAKTYYLIGHTDSDCIFWSETWEHLSNPSCACLGNAEEPTRQNAIDICKSFGHFNFVHFFKSYKEFKG